MTATLVIDDTDPEIDRIRSMDTPDLLTELANALGATVRFMKRLAMVWAELESRGEDLSKLRSGLRSYLPLIASGVVTAEAVVAFAGSAYALKFVSTLPPAEQLKLAGGEPVCVVVKQGDKFTRRMIPVKDMTTAQMRQAFGDRRVREESAQIALLDSPAPAWKPGKPVKLGSVTVDRAAGTVRVGRVIVPAEEMIEALRRSGLLPT